VKLNGTNSSLPKKLVPSNLNKLIPFYEQVRLVIFCHKLKGTTTEATEALRTTQSND
jgi:hypothetical protein